MIELLKFAFFGLVSAVAVALTKAPHTNHPVFWAIIGSAFFCWLIGFFEGVKIGEKRK